MFRAQRWPGVLHDKSPDVAAQVVDFFNQHRALAPQGAFREGDDFSAIMKTIESVDTGRVVNRRGSRLQNENYLVPNEPFHVDFGYSWSKASQGVLYSRLIAAQSQRTLSRGS